MAAHPHPAVPPNFRRKRCSRVDTGAKNGAFGSLADHTAAALSKAGARARGAFKAHARSRRDGLLRRGCSEAYGRVDAEGEDGEDGSDESRTHDIWSKMIEDWKALIDSWVCELKRRRVLLSVQSPRSIYTSIPHHKWRLGSSDHCMQAAYSLYMLPTVGSRYGRNERLEMYNPDVPVATALDAVLSVRQSALEHLRAIHWPQMSEIRSSLLSGNTSARHFEPSACLDPRAGAAFVSRSRNCQQHPGTGQ
ncbi:uncharacterized protein C8Q71DRAFT_752428 [Rhodofomes roseus]|uniref:Uncharacterized protein n=1 Tax=Rhodofomes roseus TaxID=34475 RepID=A0ABQ8KKN2_9APHY|nr:uncharacterized protein C8Q71DRAFT_752428 [Rhodofomes roseus]KAH9838670.1 hypothetical protein C8Q71DRAFT_752428 [Rhodofomes roseus]